MKMYSKPPIEEPFAQTLSGKKVVSPMDVISCLTPIRKIVQPKTDGSHRNLVDVPFTITDAMEGG
jgi:hypothetical protein